MSVPFLDISITEITYYIKKGNLGNYCNKSLFLFVYVFFLYLSWYLWHLARILVIENLWIWIRIWMWDIVYSVNLVFYQLASTSPGFACDECQLEETKSLSWKDPPLLTVWTKWDFEIYTGITSICTSVFLHIPF